MDGPRVTWFIAFSLQCSSLFTSVSFPLVRFFHRSACFVLFSSGAVLTETRGLPLGGYIHCIFLHMFLITQFSFISVCKIFPSRRCFFLQVMLLRHVDCPCVPILITCPSRFFIFIHCSFISVGKISLPSSFFLQVMLPRHVTVFCVAVLLVCPLMWCSIFISV